MCFFVRECSHEGGILGTGGNSVKGFTEDQADNIHCLSLINSFGHPVSQGD